jgi:uncharacterized protein
MPSPYIHHALTIAESPQRGRGVFTVEPIEEGTVVEIAPVIVFDAEERTHIEKTGLYNYIFEWGEDNSGCCVALGWMSIYNHAGPSNCEYVMNFESAQMAVIVWRDLAANEELTINYSTDWNERKPVWFEAF